MTPRLDRNDRAASLSSGLDLHHVVQGWFDVLHELAEPRPLLAEFRRMVCGGEPLLVGPLDVIDDMAAVLAAMQTDRHEARLLGHEPGALLHQLENLVLV